MRKCKKCGRNVENESRYCPFCGEGLKTYGKRPSPQFQAGDIQENKIMAVLAYLDFLVFIPLFAAKKSKFARYHVKQGLTSAGCRDLVCCPFSGAYFIVKAVGMARYVFCALAIFGIVNAVSGKVKRLPVIGNLL